MWKLEVHTTSIYYWSEYFKPSDCVEGLKRFMIFYEDKGILATLVMKNKEGIKILSVQTCLHT